jgi:hypothetical protein
MTHEEFVKAYTIQVLQGWNDWITNNGQISEPLGMHSNVAAMARCHAEAIWKLCYPVTEKGHEDRR